MTVETGRSATGWKVCEPRAAACGLSHFHVTQPLMHVLVHWSPRASPMPLGTLDSYLSQTRRRRISIVSTDSFPLRMILAPALSRSLCTQIP